jgi:hypothetical protein
VKKTSSQLLRGTIGCANVVYSILSSSMNKPNRVSPWRLRLVGVAIAAATIGAAILLFITDKFPGEWNKTAQVRTMAREART